MLKILEVIDFCPRFDRLGRPRRKAIETALIQPQGSFKPCLDLVEGVPNSRKQGGLSPRVHGAGGRPEKENGRAPVGSDESTIDDAQIARTRAFESLEEARNRQEGIVRRNP